MSKDAIALGVCFALAATAGAQTKMHHTAVKGRAVIQGVFKAITTDNQDRTPGVDCKFKFMADGTFKFFQKGKNGAMITNGIYEMESGVIDLKPAAMNANWPAFWTSPAELTQNAAGALIMMNITYEPSLIGKVFTPGLYRCDGHPNLRYYFNPDGGYKYTGQATSTGEYWVQRTTDPNTNEDKVALILNILRVDGQLVNYHQKVDVTDNGTSFTIDERYTYRKVVR